jgi:hypothetical protein
MVVINETTIAMACAVLGVVFSVVWLALGLYGVNSLRDIREKLNEGESGDGVETSDSLR